MVAIFNASCSKMSMHRTNTDPTKKALLRAFLILQSTIGTVGLRVNLLPSGRSVFRRFFGQ